MELTESNLQLTSFQALTEVKHYEVIDEQDFEKSAINSFSLKETMSILCPKCGLPCGEAEYKVHEANNCSTVKCPKCPQFYSNAEALLRHTRAVHDKEFQCSICNIDYASKYNLKRHLAFTHKQVENGKKTTKCEQCGEIFMGKYFLKRHIQHVHNKEFTCTLCKKEFTSIYTLKRHAKSRHANGQEAGSEKSNNTVRIKCPKCGKAIAKSCLARHLRIRHSKSFTCHVCDRECRSEKSLQKHIDCRHAEEKSIEVLVKKKYKCPQCPQRFTASWTLKTHIKGKHEQQFQCEVCEKYFSAPFPLVRHKLNVHGIKTESDTVNPAPKKIEEDLKVKEESEADDEKPSTSQKIKLEDQAATKDELKQIIIKKEIC